MCRNTHLLYLYNYKWTHEVGVSNRVDSKWTQFLKNSSSTAMTRTSTTHTNTYANMTISESRNQCHCNVILVRALAKTSLSLVF